MPPLNLYARVRFSLCILHTRPRVQRAPGIPCALCHREGQRHAKLGSIMPRAGEGVSCLREAARQFMIATESNYKTDALREMWVAPVTRHAKPFHHLKVDAITQDDIMSVVEPIWNEIPATAQQLLNKLGRILAFATAKRWRSGNNPADWKVLKYLLSKPRKLTKGHRAALPYPEAPASVATLRTQPNVTARALEFLILSACRANEALQLKWDEIDLASESLTVPASRMKAGKARCGAADGSHGGDLRRDGRVPHE